MIVDASVVVSYLVPHEARHEATRRWLAGHVAGGGLLIAPALLLPEVAGAIGRRTGRPRLARRAIDALLRLPSLRLLALDETLARAAATVAARLRVRGADAVYIAAAAELRLPLVTWDLEQRERAAGVVDVVVPET
jgi:predicted nucleic acid-binding protein